MIPEPSLMPPEPKIKGFCAGCNGEIYEGNRYWEINKLIYCKACIDDAEAVE